MTRKAYLSDLSDDEWAFVAPYLTLMREDAPQRDYSLHKAFNGLRYIVHTGEQPAADAEAHGIRLEVLKLPAAKRGFVPLPRRWVVERSFAWMARFRRLARDYERLAETLVGLHFVAFAAKNPRELKVVEAQVARLRRLFRLGDINEAEYLTERDELKARRASRRSHPSCSHTGRGSA